MLSKLYLAGGPLCGAGMVVRRVRLAADASLSELLLPVGADRPSLLRGVGRGGAVGVCAVRAGEVVVSRGRAVIELVLLLGRERVVVLRMGLLVVVRWRGWRAWVGEGVLIVRLGVVHSHHNQTNEEGSVNGSSVIGLVV